MITPSFSLTATERVLPKLALDFTTASLDSRVTFTRTTGASNPATYVNSSGVIALATNNEPRFDFDPASLACKGLLIEESRTNTCLNSGDVSTLTVAAGSVTANAAISPNGTTTAARLYGASAFNRYSLFALATGTTYTWSMFLKKSGSSDSVDLYVFLPGTGNVQQGRFNLANGTASNIVGATASISLATNGYYRCSISYTSTNNNTHSFGVAGINSNDECYAWGAQREVGAFATSYIPTTSAALTRNADVATMTGTNFSSWYNASEGTLLSWFTTEPGTTGNLQRCGLAFSDGTTSNRIVPVINTSTAMLCLVTAGGVSQAGLAPTTTNIFSGQNKVALAYKQDNFGACINAGTVQTDVSGTVPTVTQAQIARVENAAGNFLNGWVQKCFYYPQRLTDAQLQAITK